MGYHGFVAFKYFVLKLKDTNNVPRDDSDINGASSVVKTIYGCIPVTEIFQFQRKPIDMAARIVIPENIVNVADVDNGRGRGTSEGEYIDGIYYCRSKQIEFGTMTMDDTNKLINKDQYYNDEYINREKFHFAKYHLYFVKRLLDDEEILIFIRLCKLSSIYQCD